MTRTAIRPWAIRALVGLALMGPVLQSTPCSAKGLFHTYYSKTTTKTKVCGHPPAAAQTAAPAAPAMAPIAAPSYPVGAPTMYVPMYYSPVMAPVAPSYYAAPAMPTAPWFAAPAAPAAPVAPQLPNYAPPQAPAPSAQGQR